MLPDQEESQDWTNCLSLCVAKCCHFDVVVCDVNCHSIYCYTCEKILYLLITCAFFFFLNHSYLHFLKGSLKISHTLIQIRSGHRGRLTSTDQLHQLQFNALFHTLNCLGALRAPYLIRFISNAPHVAGKLQAGKAENVSDQSFQVKSWLTFLRTTNGLVCRSNFAITRSQKTLRQQQGATFSGGNV